MLHQGIQSVILASQKVGHNVNGLRQLHKYTNGFVTGRFKPVLPHSWQRELTLSPSALHDTVWRNGAFTASHTATTATTATTAPMATSSVVVYGALPRVRKNLPTQQMTGASNPAIYSELAFSRGFSSLFSTVDPAGALAGFERFSFFSEPVALWLALKWCLGAENRCSCRDRGDLGMVLGLNRISSTRTACESKRWRTGSRHS
jgi:hypothetical protein